MFNQPLPNPDPIPLPAPVWLLHSLLVITFILHIIPMNFALGGGFITAISYALGRRERNLNHHILARGLGQILPYTIAGAITLGIAPLLFLQTIYGQFFYTSSIIIAWSWLLIIPLLIISYYGFYFFNFRITDWKTVSPLVLWICSFLLAIIAFLYTNNMVLMLTPEKWNEMYFLNPYGLSLNLSDTTIYPRFLHFFIASLAIGGMLVTYYGLYKKKKDEKVGRWAIRYGAKWFTFSTIVQFIVGFWFLFSLPAHIRQKFLRQDAVLTLILIVAISLALLAIAILHLSTYRRTQSKGVAISSLLILLTITLMVVIRDSIRSSYLKPYFDIYAYPVRPQCDVFIIFILFFITAIVTLSWMVIRVVFAKRIVS